VFNLDLLQVMTELGVLDNIEVLGVGVHLANVTLKLRELHKLKYCFRDAKFITSLQRLPKSRGRQRVGKRKRLICLAWKEVANVIEKLLLIFASTHNAHERSHASKICRRAQASGFAGMTVNGEADIANNKVICQAN
jgi:hypothetical protein